MGGREREGGGRSQVMAPVTEVIISTSGGIEHRFNTLDDNTNTSCHLTLPCTKHVKGNGPLIVIH